MKKVFLIFSLVGLVGSMAFARLNPSDFKPENDPNLHRNGASGTSMSDFVMMAAEVVAVGAGLSGSSEQPFSTNDVQRAGPALTTDTKGDEPESNEPGVEI